jgi:protein-disulfide isomerase
MNSEKIIFIIIGIFTLGIFGFIFSNVLKSQPVKFDSIAPIDLLGSNPHKRGAPNPKLTIVEFSDFECPSCHSFEPYINQILAKNSETVDFVYRHFPLPGHASALPAAKASEAAALQGKFWEYHDELFASFPNYNEETYKKIAEKLNLDMNKFNESRSSSEVINNVNEDLDYSKKLNLSGTPSFFIIFDGKVEPVNILDFTSLESAVDAKLKSVN